MVLNKQVWHFFRENSVKDATIQFIRRLELKCVGMVSLFSRML